MSMRMTEAEPIDLPQMMKRRAAPMVGEWQRNSGATMSCYALTIGMPIPITRQLMIIAIPTIWQSAAMLPTPIRLL